MTTDEYRELTAADLAERWRPKTALESLTAAAAEPVGEEYATQEEALQWLRKLAWSDLQYQRDQALNGVWSIACEGAVSRIRGLTSLVGPEPWESVPVGLILDGLYERLHETIGHPTPLTDEDRARAKAVMDHRSR